MKFATQFTAHKYVGLAFKEPTMTKQAPANEVDINHIMAQYMKATGLSADEVMDKLEALYSKQQFGDATALPSFEEAQNMVAEGRRLFDELPSKVRERFSNNPAYFLEFMQDPDNVDEAVKLGLAVKKEQPVVAEKPVVETPVVATQTAEAVSQ